MPSARADFGGSSLHAWVFCVFRSGSGLEMKMLVRVVQVLPVETKKEVEEDERVPGGAGGGTAVEDLLLGKLPPQHPRTVPLAQGLPRAPAPRQPMISSESWITRKRIE